MRYIIGIDLGTTNSCVSYVDTESLKKAIQPFAIPQLVGPGYTDNQQTLPSFCYLSSPYEWPEKTTDLPWKNNTNDIIGRFAQEQGSKVPTKLVSSAKSWLCHSAANRKDKILPTEASSENNKISPVEATARYLKHIKESWDYTIAHNDPTAEFEEQEIILTVPASFDEVARSLTIEAAKCAGYQKMTLLEEPQAAFYAWISHHEQNWQKKFNPNDYILVCDVGGGTTDFSLMQVLEKEGQLAIQRMAVGNHLLLGGDNMDVSLAHYLEQKMRQADPNMSELTSIQWLQLRHEARKAKETLLDPHSKQSKYSVLLQGTGSNLIKGSLSLEISTNEVEDFLINGFFGNYEWNDALKLKRGSAIRSMGLPYEEEPSITKHLAAFLKRSTPADQTQIIPSYVLFNGGTMTPASFQTAIINNLKNWFPQSPINVLPSPHLDLSVGRGAAYYGKVRRGLGTRIGGGSARGYYLAVNTQENDKKALTLLPRGAEEGSAFEPDEQFWLLPNTPVSFQIYSSNVRLYDKSGELIEIDSEELQPLPPIHSILRYGKQKGPQEEKIPVKLGLKLTEIGTLHLWLEAPKTGHKWELEFQLRTSSGQENSIFQLDNIRTDEIFDIEHLKKAKALLTESFSNKNPSSLGKLMESLEKELNQDRKDWSISILRGLCDELLPLAAQKKNSIEHENRWWNLLGFFLRPGFGYPLDDFRTKEIWKVILNDLKSSKPIETQIQQWICWRRSAGGFNKGQQIQLGSSILPSVLNKKFDIVELKSKSEIYPFSEKIRLLGALELLDINTKVKLGEALVKKVCAGVASPGDYWCIGRLGARQLVHGSISNVLPKEICEDWTKKLLEGSQNKGYIKFILMQFGKKTDHREINISEDLRNKIISHFTEDQAFKDSLEEGQLTFQEQEMVFGDKLPIGLTFKI